MAIRLQAGPLRNAAMVNVTDGTMCRMPSPLAAAIRSAHTRELTTLDLAAGRDPMRGDVEVCGFGRLCVAHVPVPGFARLFIKLHLHLFRTGGPLYLQDTSRTMQLTVSLISSGRLNYIWRSQPPFSELPRNSAIRVWQVRGNTFKTAGLDSGMYSLVVGTPIWRHASVAFGMNATWASGTPEVWVQQFVFRAVPEAARADQAA